MAARAEAVLPVSQANTLPVAPAQGADRLKMMAAARPDDVREPSRSGADAFEIAVHPISNRQIPDIAPVWQASFAALRAGLLLGHVLAAWPPRPRFGLERLLPTFLAIHVLGP